MQNRLLSKSAAAKILGIGKDKLGKLITSGRIGFIQIEDRIYIPYTEILEFIKNSTVRISKDSDKHAVRLSSLTKSKVKEVSPNQFDSIKMFNKLLEGTISNGKYLQ